MIQLFDRLSRFYQRGTAFVRRYGMPTIWLTVVVTGAMIGPIVGFARVEASRLRAVIDQHAATIRAQDVLIDCLDRLINLMAVRCASVGPNTPTAFAPPLTADLSGESQTIAPKDTPSGDVPNFDGPNITSIVRGTIDVVGPSTSKWWLGFVDGPRFWPIMEIQATDTGGEFEQTIDVPSSVGSGQFVLVQTGGDAHAWFTHNTSTGLFTKPLASVLPNVFQTRIVNANPLLQGR